MNQITLTKSRTIFFSLIVILMACCKSSDPAPVACKITFKGKNYGLPFAACSEIAPDKYMDGQDTETNPGQTISLIKSTTAGVDQIMFMGSVSDLTTYYSTVQNASIPTITISGKTWTFSGTVENTAGDKGEISGTCTCK